MTGKERLERIIQMQYDGYTIWDMSEDDLVWLIEQAGRVHELERKIERYRKALEEIRDIGICGRIISTGEIMRSDEANLAEEALEGEE